jgi:hypothetical protein
MRKKKWKERREIYSIKMRKKRVIERREIV